MDLIRQAGVVGLLLSVCLSGCATEQRPSPQPRHRAPAPAAHEATGAGCSDEDLRRGPRQVLKGYASYYADSLSGNRTANGERYDPELFSAAHRTLPFGTRLRVTRTDAALDPVCVTINDRGPFAGRRRIVDLSRAAAEQLEMLGEGVVPVRVEVL